MNATRPLSGNPALAPLLVIEKLEVEVTSLKTDRVTAIYRVTQNGKTDETEFIYRYAEDVFDPKNEADQNFATMMAVQPALNYGLFCQRIVVRGPLDARDRKFITNYAAHTAREIYVHKILSPNPFLTEAVRGVEAIRSQTYLQAHIEFSDAKTVKGNWATHSDRVAVLSSGGKDSLLTFGLLSEICSDLHPLFVNESGGHWFTAINAWRHFEKSVPNSARVWTNSDRLFTWMLKHLPFVRKDFASVRADIYPIRLWTVAIFIFSVLPLMRKRGIGRLTIGNEFDSSSRHSHHGITHYDGYFDQSRWFDSAMTRYFQGKGWGVTQFSVLRPMSELLIEKTLIERYPELLSLQVSCHSAHIEQERAVPCGKCEKCRRIVAMISALGGDPSVCGYTEEMVRSCLDGFMKLGTHQELPAFEQTRHLLRERGLVPKETSAKPNSEAMALRFDTERSPMDTLPRDLRAPLFKIMLEHATGAMEKHGRHWVRFNPLTSAELARPHAFDRPGKTQQKHDYPHPVRLGPLNWPQAKRRFAEVDVALLPVGAIEQHGPHLPLDTDAWDAERLCDDVALACSEPRPIVLPGISYGVSYHHDDFPGTFSVGPDALAQIVHDIGLAAARNGISKLLIINGHGGNSAALHFAAQLINRDTGIFTAVDTGESSDTDIDALTETPNDVHAGEVETSTTLALRPELVDLSKAVTCIPRFSNEYLDFTSKRGIGWYADTKKMSESGVLGDPTKASREKGERMWQIMIDNLVELIEDLKVMSLAEIHQRRY